MRIGEVRKAVSKAKKAQDRSPGFDGWNTSDEDERARRRWRGLTEIASVDNLEPAHPYFGTFRVRSSSGGVYEVEIRSLREAENSCGCPDWRVNGLGTCKHIEGVLEHLRRKGKRAFAAASDAGSGRVEIFPAVDGSYKVEIRLAASAGEADGIVSAYATPQGQLAGDPLAVMQELQGRLAGEAAGAVRFSRQLDSMLEEERRRRRRRQDREAFCADVDSGRAILDILHHKLLPYQQEGVLHLAFGERALLADEMGSARPCRPSAPAHCCAGYVASSAFWWCCRRR